MQGRIVRWRANSRAKPAVTSVVFSAIWAACLVFGQSGFEGPGRYEIINVTFGKPLEVDHNQQWDIASVRSDSYSIRNPLNGKALEAPMACVRFDGNPNQQWRIRHGRDGRVSIVSRGGWTLDVDSNPWFTFRRVGASDAVCFYQKPDYRGDSWCKATGENASEMNREARSLKLFGDAQVEVFEHPGFRGERRHITHDERDLTRLGRIESFRVQ